MDHFSPQLQAALDAADTAGEVLRRKYTTVRQVTQKGPREIVTDADLASQASLQASLSARFPDYILISEEGRHDLDLSALVPTWIVDPVDGTTNYAQRIPTFCITIALRHQGETLLGVVHDPLRRETFFAVKGKGAYLKTGRKAAVPIRVSLVAPLSAAVIATDWPRQLDLRHRVGEALVRVTSRCRSARVMGTAALSLVYVAAGRLDGYYQLVLQAWDVAAAALILTEAGGTITTPSGKPWSLSMLAAVASNGRIHPELVAALELDE
jgi:myo-inositol-1(or 4)-monophosphatase